MDLQLIRKDIDKIDKEIVELFEKRMKLTYDVAAFKIETGKKVYDKQREEEKLEVLSGLTEDTFNKQAIRELFTQIMAISRKKQYSLVKEEDFDTECLVPLEELPKGKKKVACFGERGSYTEQAMEEFFGPEIEGINKKTFKEVMDALDQGEAEYGVLPIENSSTGGITDIYDLLVNSNKCIIGEHVVKVDQALIGLPGTKLEQVHTVFSHEQGILQCRAFLEQHPHIKTKAFGSTSGSVKKVKEDGDFGQVAIGSERAARYYDLEVLQSNINADKENSTRFIVITNQKVYMKKGKKISICFELKHESGSLYRMLSHFLFNDLSLTKIESRPIENRAWEYRFFLEFEGNLEDASVQNVMRGVKEEANNVYMFGNF